MKYKNLLPRALLRRTGLYAPLRGKRKNYYTFDGKKGVQLTQRWGDLDRIADLRPTDRLLDLGCAEGLVTMEAAKKVKHATGVELVPYRCDNARKIAAERGIDNVEFIKGSYFSAVNGTYDVILMMGVYGGKKLIGPKELSKFLGISRRKMYVSIDTRHVETVRKVAQESRFEAEMHPTEFLKADIIAECTRLAPPAEPMD